MADWTTIPNAALAIGAPNRASNKIALRENPIAIAEGRPGAPRHSPWSVVQTVAAGDTVRYTDMTAAGLSRSMGTSFIVSKSVTILADGTVRVKYQTSRPNSGTLTTQLVRRRGTASTMLGEQTHSSGSGSATLNRSVASVVVEPGDSIVLQGRFTSGDALTSVASFQNFTIGTSGGYLWAIGGGSMVLAAEPT